MAIYIWKELKTLTISWEEKSDMSSGWTYSDDAAGLTAGDSVFDEFFGYYACRLASDGTETGKVEQSSPGILDITQLGDLTSGDNVMIAFPVMGIKMSKSGSQVTLSITKELNKAGYQYYAHTKSGTLDNPGTPENVMYLGAYKSSMIGGGRLVSRTGKSTLTYSNMVNMCNWAKLNGSNWNTCGFYQRQFVIALYMMKYGNPNCQSVVGNGYTSGTSTTTGGTSNQTDATYGTSSASAQIKLFGLEDFRGNAMDFIGGAMVNGSRVLLTSFSGRSGSTNTSDYPLNTGTYFVSSSGCVSSVAGNNYALLLPTGLNGSNYSTYYCDYSSGTTNALLSTASMGDNLATGIFNIIPASSTGCRLMYL